MSEGVCQADLGGRSWFRGASFAGRWSSHVVKKSVGIGAVGQSSLGVWSGAPRRGGRLYLVGGWVRSCRVCVPGLGAGALRSRTWVSWFRLFRTVNVIMHMHMYHNMHTPHTVGHTKVYV